MCRFEHKLGTQGRDLARKKLELSVLASVLQNASNY